MRRRALIGLLALPLLACQPPDPKQELAVSDAECYWAIDKNSGGTLYIAPVVRFQVKNVGQREQRTLQATVTFRRKGEEQTWGSAWLEVTPRGKPLKPGESTTVALKSDGRYYSTGPLEGMFEHQLFKDAHATLFLRLGGSPWVEFASLDAERRIGSRTVEEAPATP